jgi:hypothetical protein
MRVICRCAATDEISTGLDSATITEAMQVFRIAVDVFRSAGLVSLLQPPPEVYELFDNVMLMREGRIVYHGPRKLVLLYLADMGLVCPDDTDAAGTSYAVRLPRDLPVVNCILAGLLVAAIVVAVPACVSCATCVLCFQGGEYHCVVHHHRFHHRLSV